MIVAIDRPPFKAKVMITVPKPKTVFKTTSTEQPQQFKALILKYLGPVEAICLVSILQYELA